MEPVGTDRSHILVLNYNGRALLGECLPSVVEAAARFESEILITKDGQDVNARSIMGLMMLAASLGTEIQISAEGPDAAEALVALLALAEAKFGEE